MKSFYEFDFEGVSVDKSFSLKQKELVLKSSLGNNKFSFDSIDVEYKCELEGKDITGTKPVAIIPIRNNSELLEVTLNNLKENQVDKICDIIVVDDRSSEDLKSIVLDNSLTYLRVDNEKGFNFSMLNNIAAKVAHEKGAGTVIFWNSDLWCADKSHLEELISRHNNSGSKISGTKLVYPPLEMSLNKEKDNKNITTYFPTMADGKWREKTQFGGDRWRMLLQGPIVLAPDHYLRFTNPTDPRVNCDRGAAFVTGALQIWDLEHFISMGGFNPSLSKNLQDTDACLKSIELGYPPLYFGKDIFFYHDESFNMNNNLEEKKEDKQFVSDHVLFGKIWNEKATALVYGAME